MPRKTTDILIVDDDAALAEMLQMHADDLGYQAEMAHSGADARTFLDKNPTRLVLLDQHLPDTLGLKLLGWIKENHPKIDVVMVTGFHEMELVITAMKAGATEYIHKPIDTEKLDAVLKSALKKRREELALKTAPRTPKGNAPEIIGVSPTMVEVGKKIATAALNDAPVLIRGASGTGKELVAKAVHVHSGKKGDFVAVNCASIVETLLESELFGHEKGAFTGAESTKKGRFEVAEDGTLFLDEIGEMSPHLQAKLLRVLQEQTFERVGGTTPHKTNARIIAATHRDLAKMVKEGTFREDLLYRLDVIGINVPTLSQRPDDFEPLIAYLLMRLNAHLDKTIKGMTADALKALQAREWEGNVRELENTLTRIMAHTAHDVITLKDIEKGTAQANAKPDNAPLKQPARLAPLEQIEKEHILNVYKATDQHKGKTCAILGISRPALDRRLKKWDV
mgnify:CR=1 FL=1